MFQRAKPIWIKDKSTEKNVFAVFRAKIELFEEAELHITGATFYHVFVNGEFVGFGPARAAYGYARKDILPVKGRNGVCEIVIEACGYYCKTLSTVFQPSFLMAEVRSGRETLAWTGRDFTGYLPGCRLQKTERYSRQRHFTEIWDYRNFSFMTDEKYRAEVELLSLDLTVIERRAPYPLYEEIGAADVSIRGTYEFDETLPYRREKYSGGCLPDDWGFWKDEDVELHPHTWIQRQKQTVTGRKEKLPVSLKKGEYVILDFGRMEVGFLKASIKAMAESDVVIAFSEYYEGDTFQLPNMNAHNALEYFYKEGDQRETMTFEPYTCRFVMLAVKEGCIRLDAFGIKTCMFDIRNVEYPDYQNEEINAIYRAAVRTFAHNSVDIYMDCPSRERAGWLCDSYFTSKTEYALTGRTAVEDAFLENFRLYKNLGDIHPGAIPMCYPADIETDTPEGKFIPQWTMWYILESADYILRRGHTDMAEAFRDSIYMLLGFYRQYENEDGLLERLPSWNFVEWSRANDWTQDVNYPTNFLYAQVLESIADIYGDEECRKRSSEVRQKAVEQSFNGTYFVDHAVRNEEGTLCRLEDSSEACQYYAALFGGIDLNSETFRPLRCLITDVFAPDRKGNMPEIMEVNAFIGAYLRLETLLKMGEYELLLENVKGFFGNMETYTGTLWEYRQFCGSCDHGFASYALVAIREAMRALK